MIEWYPKITDTSLKYLTPKYSPEIYETDVQMNKLTSFFNWKHQCLKYKCLFIQIKKSEYIYCIVPDLSYEVIGIWCISENIGFLTKLIKFQPLLTVSDILQIIPECQLNLSNQEIFNFQSTEKLKEITEYSKELFTRFITDSSNKNIPKETLAIKAIKASSTFHESIEDYSKVYFSAKG